MSKIIRDIIHGYISLDEFFCELIDNGHFQRLRFIKQLTSQQVYPSANHTRFEHSLGVYHLARLYVDNLRAGLLENDLEMNDYDVLLLNVSIAALLHDVGHAPLSHLGECYYSVKNIKEALMPLCDCYHIDRDIFKYGARHERMSCYIVLKYYYEIIKKVLNKINLYEFDDIDFEWICRMIVGVKYDKKDLWYKNIGIEIINSDTVDVDKIDYIMRDSFMTGISVPSVDVRRLFRSIIIHPKTKKVLFSQQAITVVQNIIDARDCLYILTCNHHAVVYNDFLIEYYIRNLLLLQQKKDSEYIDKIDPVEIFSCDAIGDKLVTDNDLMELLKRYYCDKTSSISTFTKDISKQIFERDYLKPLWKNLYEFNKFLNENIKDECLISDAKKKLSEKDRIYRRYVVNEIRKELALEWGDIFIAPRSNKFSNSGYKKFYIYCNDDHTAREIGTMLPQKNYANMFDNEFFYVYVKSDDKRRISKSFINVLKRGIPDKINIAEKSVEIEWLIE